MGISGSRPGGGFPGKQPGGFGGLGPQVGQLRQFDQPQGGGFQQQQPYGKPQTGGEFQRPQGQPEPFGGYQQPDPYQQPQGPQFQQMQPQPQTMRPQQGFAGQQIEQFDPFGPKRGGFVGQISPFLQRY